MICAKAVTPMDPSHVLDRIATAPPRDCARRLESQLALRLWTGNCVSARVYIQAVEDSDYSGAMAPVYASAAAELVRLLKQSTREADGMHDAVDASALLWNLAQLLEDLPVALRQVTAWLDHESAKGLVSVDCGPYERHPDEAVGVVNAYLVAVRGVLEQAATGVRAAQVIAETLSTVDAGVPGRDVAAVSTDVDTSALQPEAESSLARFPHAACRPVP